MGELTFYQWANALKGYMLAIGVAFGMYIVVLWWRSNAATVRRNDEAKARGIFADHLVRLIELGEVVRPPGKGTDQLRLGSQYATFVTYLVTVAGQILTLCPTESWERTLRVHLAPHRGLLSSSAFSATIDGIMTPELQRLIDDIVRGDPAPAITATKAED